MKACLGLVGIVKPWGYAADPKNKVGNVIAAVCVWTIDEEKETNLQG